MTQYLVHEDSYAGRGGRVTMPRVAAGGVPWPPHHGPAVWAEGWPPPRIDASKGLVSPPAPTPLTATSTQDLWQRDGRHQSRAHGP